MSHNLIRIVFAVAAVLLGSAGAGAQFQVPSPDEVFRLSASKNPDGGVILDWTIAPDTYLHRDKMTAAPAADRAAPFAVETGPGTKKDDPTFGAMEVYYGAAQARIAADTLAAAGAPRALRVTCQGKYETVHNALMSIPGTKIGKEKMTEAVQASGVDMNRLNQDLKQHGAEITSLIRRNLVQAE